MISKEEFLDWIKKEIMPQLSEIEETKLKLFLLLKHNIIKMVKIAIALFVIGIIFQIGIFTLLIPLLAFLCVLANWRLRLYQKEIKKRFLVQILSKFNLKPITSKEIPCDNIPDLAKQGLLSGYTTYFKVDDCFGSTASKIPFYVEEISIRNSKTIFFHGPVVCFCLDKVFQGKTLILSNQKIMNKYDIFSNKIINALKIQNTSDRLEKMQSNIKIEDIDFNKQFTIYTTDQVEARTILTPAIIERIKKIRSLATTLTYNSDFGGKTDWYDCPVDVLFRGKNVILTVNAHKNMFEFFDISKIFFHNELKDNNRSIINVEDFDKFYDEIAALFEFQELLKMN